MKFPKGLNYDEAKTWILERILGDLQTMELPFKWALYNGVVVNPPETAISAITHHWPALTESHQTAGVCVWVESGKRLSRVHWVG